MTISLGDRLPDANLLVMGADGIETVPLLEALKDRRVVIFGLPGAYTRTCSAAHLPSFIRAAAALADQGVDEIICLSVNDPFVMASWGRDTGATKAGITMLADADGAYTRSIGMEFSAPATGLLGRSLRYSMLVDDGVVAIFNSGDVPGSCELSAGDTMLDQITELDTKALA